MKHIKEWKIWKDWKDKPIDIREYAAGGIVTVIIGVLMILQPFQNINDLFNQEFLKYIRYGGIITVVEGIFYLGQAISGKTNIFGHQIFLTGFLITLIGSIFITHQVINNPSSLDWDIFSVSLWLIYIVLVLSYLTIGVKIKKISTVSEKVAITNA